MAEVPPDKEKKAAAGVFERPTPGMLGAARILAGLSRGGLAEASGLSLSAVERLEGGAVRTRIGNIDRIVAAFAARGVVFAGGSAADREAVLLVPPPPPGGTVALPGDHLDRLMLIPLRTSVRPSPRAVSAARQLIGLSQRDASEALAVSRSALFKFEQGSPDTRTDTLDRICAGLGRRGIRFLPESGPVLGGVMLIRRPG